MGEGEGALLMGKNRHGHDTDDIPGMHTFHRAEPREMFR